MVAWLAALIGASVLQLAARQPPAWRGSRSARVTFIAFVSRQPALRGERERLQHHDRQSHAGHERLQQRLLNKTVNVTNITYQNQHINNAVSRRHKPISLPRNPFIAT